jgi:hypothetical protein
MTSLPRLRVGLLTPALGLLLAAGAQAQAPRADQQTPPQQPPPQQQLSMQQAQEAAEQQPPAEPPPGYLLGVEGSAVLERDNTTGDAIPGMPLLIGDRLRSEGGRLEVKWAERSELRLARYTDLDVLARGMVRVPRGRVTIHLVVAPGQSAHDQLAIDAPGASVRFFAAGEYHVTVGGSGAPEVELAVVRGSAQLASDRGMLMLAEGERSVVKDGGVPLAAGPYVARADDDPVEEDADEDATADPRDAQGAYDPTPDLEAFQRSSAGGAYGGTSYLPTELYGYETVLNQNGTWMSDPSYGYVWYPRVQSDWRPYYRGRWHHVPRYGWTWIGAERWAWPTHHYGRWGFHQARGFYWIPARKWGAAWVSWAVAPNYVGWCPLGWDGRPVFGFASFGGTTVVARGRHDPWRGWTVVNSGRFGRGYDVHRHRVDHRVIVRERPAFVTAWGPPRRAGISGDLIVHGEARDGRGVPAPPRHGYGDSRNVYGSRDSSARGGSGARSSGSRGGSRIGDPGIIVPRDNNAEPEESPYDRALRVMNRRGDRNQPNGARQRDGSSNPGDGAPGRSGDAPSTVVTPGTRNPSAYPNSYGGYGAYPRNGGVVTRQPSTGGDGDSSPGVSRSPAQDDAPGMSRPRGYDGGGAVRRYGNGGDSNGNNDSNGGDRGRRSGGDSDRGARYGDGAGRRSGGDSNDGGSSAGSSRERSGPGPSGVSVPRHGGSSDGGGSSAGRSSDRGDRGGSSAGRSSDGGGRSGGRSDGGSGGGAVRRNPR